MTLAKAISKCLCGRRTASELEEEFNDKLADLGNKFLSQIKYDLKDTVDVNDMFMLLAYRKSFIKKQSVCSDCFETSAETICSRVLRILYK